MIVDTTKKDMDEFKEVVKKVYQESMPFHKFNDAMSEAYLLGYHHANRNAKDIFVKEVSRDS